MTLSKQYYPRKDAEQKLMRFLEASVISAQLVFFRGRRRLGKSLMLKYIQSDYPRKCFYFSGALDESGKHTLERFATSWSKFCTSSELGYTKESMLSWSYIFEKIREEIKQRTEDTWIFFDEIQWLARSKNGFLGLFKEAWLELEKIPKLKIILCGSSNKFFVDNTGGEEKILRGLVTHSDIFLRPFLTSEVKEYYGKNLSDEEVIFLYLCFGGIPYYLKQFDFTLGFINGFNRAVFLQSTIFDSEVNELLNLDFNSRGITTSLKIFIAFKQRSSTLDVIRKNSRFAPSTLTEAMGKLMQYGFIKELEPVVEKIKDNLNNISLYYTDFYLHFFCRFLKNQLIKIRKNIDSNLFSNYLSSKGNLYIENFTGIAFENYIQFLIENDHRDSNLLNELEIRNDEDFSIISDAQSDIVLRTKSLKLIRYIECKWTNSGEVIEEGIRQLACIDINKYKEYKMYHAAKFLITTMQVSDRIANNAQRMGIKIIILKLRSM